MRHMSYARKSKNLSRQIGAWGIAGIGAGPDGDSTYNRTLLDGYANTSSGIGPPASPMIFPPSDWQRSAEPTPF